MAELATIARPYAEAVFRVAEAGELAAWSDFVEELAQVARLPEVLSIATSPKVSRDQVSELITRTNLAQSGDRYELDGGREGRPVIGGGGRGHFRPNLGELGVGCLH